MEIKATGSQLALSSQERCETPTASLPSGPSRGLAGRGDTPHAPGTSAQHQGCRGDPELTCCEPRPGQGTTRPQGECYHCPTYVRVSPSEQHACALTATSTFHGSSLVTSTVKSLVTSGRLLVWRLTAGSSLEPAGFLPLCPLGLGTGLLHCRGVRGVVTATHGHTDSEAVGGQGVGTPT